MSSPLRVFIGYEARQAIAYHVLAHSIQSRASKPVLVAPVALNQLRDIFTRERSPKDSTEFSISRFLVPHLAGYDGAALFMDCDMLALADLDELAPLVEKEPGVAVWVCPHDYIPKSERKHGDERLKQFKYPRKNWSSLMLFNCAHPAIKARLTPEYVNKAPALDLHRFSWLDQSEIGYLPLRWNWLVGEYEKQPIEQLKILHYTLGGPWVRGCEYSDYADVWISELWRTFTPSVFPALAGRVVKAVGDATLETLPAQVRRP